MIGGHISFDLHVIESGTPLVFDNVRRKVDIKSLPQEVSLMGANLTVQSYDPATGKIKVDIANGFREGAYGLTTTTRTDRKRVESGTRVLGRGDLGGSRNQQ